MERVPRSAWLTLAAVAAAVFMVAMELTIIALALPEIRASMNASPATLSWVVNTYSIVVAALLLPSGWLADRYGRRRIFQFGLLLFAAGSVAAAVSVSIEMLIAARALQAVGGSLQYPAGMALLLTAFPRARHQTAMGTWSATGGMAAALGPAIGAVLIEGFGWRAVFFVNVPVALITLVVGARVLVESKDEDTKSRVDTIGVPLASLGVGVIILGIVQGETWGWRSGSTLGTFAAGAVMIAAFVRRSQRHPAPLFDLGILRIRSFVLGNLGSLFFAFGFFALLVPLPTFIQEVWGWSVLHTGLAVAPGSIVSFLISPQAGRLADRIGNAPILVTGATCGTIGLLWLLSAMTTEPSLWRLLAGTMLVGVSSGAGFAQLVGAALRDVPASRYAMATAGRTTFFQLSVALAIAVAFAIIGPTVHPAATLTAYKSVWLLSAASQLGNVLLFGLAYPYDNMGSPLIARLRPGGRANKRARTARNERGRGPSSP